MKKLMILTGALAAFAVCADQVPVVSGITMTQANDSRLVTIDYTLKDATAVITLDIQTNVTDGVWASIGGENIQNVSGDVWKKVGTGAHTITWRPDLSWPDHEIANGGARAVVTAWSVDNPPDYMVVNIASDATKNSETYYPAVEFLPGGLLANSDYRQSQIVMRKIPAKGVTWTMGSAEIENGYERDASREATHRVTFEDSYYIAVFETTQTQWSLIRTDNPSYFKKVDYAMRPVEWVSYNEIRNTADSGCNYPAAPDSNSFLGLLRAKTGLAFDLPSEAQWEFACRAGHGTGSWGDGSSICSSGDDAHLTTLGRFYYNGGNVKNSSTGEYAIPGDACSAANGTAVVGSYTPNSWGLYDMHGNVGEWCLDWEKADIKDLGGGVNTVEGGSHSHMVRGGAWNCDAGGCRPAYRSVYFTLDCHFYHLGFRLALPVSPALKAE